MRRETPISALPLTDTLLTKQNRWRLANPPIKLPGQREVQGNPQNEPLITKRT